MSPALRSVLVVNRSSLIGTGIILALSGALLTITGAWLEAGLRNEDLVFLVGVASSFAGTVVMITVFVVAGVFSGALRPRRREFALLRAVGATAAQVRARVTGEALVLLAIATPVGAAVGSMLAPLLSPLLISSGIVPNGFLLLASPLPLLAVVAVLVPTGIIAARSTARGIVRVTPTAAVRDSTVDPTEISRGRMVTAGGLAVAGVLTAGIPFVAPGTIGSATAASSALLLIVAAGLAGPALVRWAAIRGTAIIGATSGPARVLAFANARGFSRRLSAAVIPLALLVALGSVQSGVNSAVTMATAQEMRAGIHADLVVTSSTGITPAQATAIAALPGITAITATGHLAGAVRTDPPDQDLPAFENLSWNPTTIITITPGEPLLDPTVRSGSLQDLGTAGTIAVSRQALLFTGKGVGDAVDVRLTGQTAGAMTIVAVYERGLAFGDYIVGSPDVGRAPTAAGFDAVLIDSGPESRTGTRKAAADLGLTVTDGAGYALIATEGSGAGQPLSLVLLLALLGFVAAAAANTLAASIRGRRDEFLLLRRLGATRTQVMGMVALETMFIIVTAVTIGLLAVLPALTGVGQGLLGVPLPVFNVPVVSALTISTILIAILAVIPAAWFATSATASRTP